MYVVRTVMLLARNPWKKLQACSRLLMGVLWNRPMQDLMHASAWGDGTALLVPAQL